MNDFLNLRVLLADHFLNLPDLLKDKLCSYIYIFIHEIFNLESDFEYENGIKTWPYTVYFDGKCIKGNIETSVIDEAYRKFLLEQCYLSQKDIEND